VKKSVIKTICVILFINIFFFSFHMTANCSTYTYSGYSSMDKVMLMQNENQVYLVGTKANVVSIDAVYPQSYNVILTLNNDVYSYNLYDNSIIFLCPIKSTNQTEVVVYDIENDYLTSFNIKGTYNYSYCNIAFDNSYVYLAKTDGHISMYNLRGKTIKEFDTQNTVHSLLCNYNNYVYALTRDGIYSINSSGCSLVQSYNFGGPARFVNNNDFVDSLGYMYRISDNSAIKLITTQSDVRYPSGGTYKNNAIVSNTSNLFSLDISSNKTLKSYNTDSYIEQFFIVKDIVVTLSFSGNTPIIKTISYDDFKSVASTNNNSSNNNNNQGNNSSSNSNLNNNSNNNNSNNSNSELNNISTIHSDIYDVDNNYLKIRGISPQTTVAQFKKNMQYNGYNVKFYKYGGNEITSGYVGTATVAKFYNNNISYEYELCIGGDLTGEGNVNSRDKNMMFDYLLNEVSFTGVFLDCADLDNSNSIDTIDLILLLRMIK